MTRFTGFLSYILSILLILSSYYREATMVRLSFVPGGRGRVNGTADYSDFTDRGGSIQSTPICETCGQQEASGRCLQCCSMSIPCAEQDWGAPFPLGMGNAMTYAERSKLKTDAVRLWNHRLPHLQRRWATRRHPCRGLCVGAPSIPRACVRGYSIRSPFVASNRHSRPAKSGHQTLQLDRACSSALSAID